MPYPVYSAPQLQQSVSLDQSNATLAREEQLLLRMLGGSLESAAVQVDRLVLQAQLAENEIAEHRWRQVRSRVWLLQDMLRDGLAEPVALLERSA